MLGSLLSSSSFLQLRARESSYSRQTFLLHCLQLLFVVYLFIKRSLVVGEPAVRRSQVRFNPVCACLSLSLKPGDRAPPVCIISQAWYRKSSRTCAGKNRPQQDVVKISEFEREYQARSPPRFLGNFGVGDTSLPPAFETLRCTLFLIKKNGFLSNFYRSQ